jgi:hypothetical protein
MLAVIKSDEASSDDEDVAEAAAPEVMAPEPVRRPLPSTGRW